MKLRFLLFVITLILMDQCVKAIVHFNMPLHSEISVIGDFIKLYHIVLSLIAMLLNRSSVAFFVFLT